MKGAVQRRVTEDARGASPTCESPRLAWRSSRRLTVGLVWWITAWAFGIKAFDAFLLTAALVVGAAA